MRERFIRALDHLVFEDNELAYLALTGKVERQILDRLAWRLYGEELIPAREWNRRDLVLLQGSDVLAALEAKAFYSFDVLAVRSFDKYKRFIWADIEKDVRLSVTFFPALVPRTERGWSAGQLLTCVWRSTSGCVDRLPET